MQDKRISFGIGVWAAVFVGACVAYGQTNSPPVQPLRATSCVSPVYNVAPSPSDPDEAALRLARGQQFARGGKPLADLPAGWPAPALVLRPIVTEPIPVSRSDLVVVGEVGSAQSYLSADGSEIYTEFSVSVEEVPKNNPRSGVNNGDIVEVDRPGGALRLAGGRILRFGFVGAGPAPCVGDRYVLFLTYDGSLRTYSILKSWQLMNGQAVPMNPHDVALEERGKNPFAGMEEASFLGAVRKAVKRAASSGSPGDAEEEAASRATHQDWLRRNAAWRT